MKEFQKQHIVSETYLKHFSFNCDGKNIFIIDNENLYHKGIQYKNSGDSTFWEMNYSDSYLFTDKKAIEKMFGREIEPNYNKIINEIEAEDSEISFNIKQKLMQWIFYTKMRSPIWEPSNFCKSNVSRYTQKLHLNNFTNEVRFKTTLDAFVQDAMNKRWTIYKNPENKYWWTSDNSGYCINLKSYELGELIFPDPYCELSGVDTILFYPLSKKYCLNIHAYEYGEDIRLNLSNTNVTFIQAEESWVELIKFWTYLSQSRLIISSENESLRKVEEIKTEPKKN